MKLLPRQIFHTPILLGITLLFALFVCVPQPVLAQFYYEDAYYMLEEGYCAYESNVQDAFAAQNPTASSPSQIRGRQNIWEDEYDEDLHPGDPLPLGDHTILFVLAAITAMSIFIQQRKRRQSSSAKTLLTTLAFIFVASPLFALTNGDLRLQYIEQELKKDGKKTIINRLYHFESHTFTLEEGKRDTISVHIFNMIKGGKDHVNHPEIVLQEYDGSKWVDKEAHMIFGPLKGDAGMGLLPGRKNAGETSDSPVDDWVIQDGIEYIKNDQRYADKGYRASGVWNFVITKNDDGKVTFDMTQVHRHGGNFYVRVNGDPNYQNDTNLVTFSEYAYKHIYEDPIGALKPHDYTHYDCKFLPSNSNITFTIATEHSPRIADELMVNSQRYKSNPTITDQYVTSDGGRPILPAAANIRFSWDIMTNRLTRAYIGNTKSTTNECLVIEEDLPETTSPGYFQDNTDWMYSVDLGSKKGTQIIVRAKYNGKNQLIWGINESTGSPLIANDGSGDQTIYPIRVIYDFKDHRIVTIYKPEVSTAGEVNLNTPVMIHRVHNDQATQILFPSNTDKVVATGDNTEDKYTHPAYAVLTFLEDKFATNATTSHYEKMFYWVSFPFDVNLKDVFGLGAYGDYWAVQYYDGAKRALEGLPTEASTGWEYVAETKEEAATKILKANTGYVVCLNYKRLSKDYNYAAGGGRKVSLYFPSANRVSPAEIKQQSDVTVSLAEYTNTTMGSNTTWNHHNWHLLGVPSYANPDFRTTQGNVPFFYQYWHPTDGYAAVASTEVNFYAMHSYMVQYAGKIEWSKIVNTTPSNIAAKKNSSAIDKTMLRIELLQADKMADKTYVQLREEEGTLGFDINLDLTKLINKGANIYTVVNGDKMAGNIVPADAELIPLGVVITEAGEYSFTMPSNTNGAFVEFIDYERSTTTNLLAMDYIVNLPAGTLEDRFALRIQPNKVVTSLENIGNEAKGEKADVKKYLIDGALYLLKDGVLYDAQGHYVQ